MNSWLSRFSRDLAIDLGTANTLVALADQGIIINEPSIVAINTKTGHIVAVGADAKKMLGKTPPHIVVTRPLVKGTISDFEVTEKMLKYFFDKANKISKALVARPRVIIGVPLNITEVEHKAVEDAALSAGARQVFLVEEPVSAAIGARLPIQQPVGNMIVDIGGGTTGIAVLSLSGVVNARNLTVAGDDMTRNIVQYAREHCGLLLGENIAEEIKIKIGAATQTSEPQEFAMRGRDLLTGLPREVIVGEGQIREAIMKPLKIIIDAIKTTIETTPPELVADIYERGIVLAGGGALLKGLAVLIEKVAEVSVRVADDPLTCVVRGNAVLLDNPELLEEVALARSETMKAYTS